MPRNEGSCTKEPSFSIDDAIDFVEGHEII